ncbi:solute carrier family 52, riboflavin transporter, member 3-B-like [Schistocerca nitens]|uniref:solute carrier family 52, riboflavin transporter, member 3-B-like n=1 Tax=Schistocerca nitens TaxID=7011 RepID=UPI00211893C5|nr:solute carrier family 52, riboflavin transporter, member 3-B-like [Schistocerca nitens]XP_049815791.1 solute carrier family 52, riboflavin transporter, member 3-B-like [Schistocerca nitens]XP_049815792.1 solute carrier family 52, riboflavin transporter, member 3-B-like [Schistocerca nitens]XP_049815793.1 solute carrier family 52, riboflavin transporter, member 3-B-like [Schistocerca nitens]
MKFCARQLSERKILVDILAILFGIGTWIAVNGLFVQLPLLVQTQPEGWNLPSYICIIIQIANIGPLLYAILQKTFPGVLRDSIIIYAILLIGTVALLLLPFLYKETTYIDGEEHSTALLALSFFIALVGCTSSVLFMPFMRNYKEMYLISYFVGEGLSGFLPSIVALVQGVGGNPICVNQTLTNSSNQNGNSEVTLVPYTPPPNFSTTAFLFFLFGTLFISTISFALLNNLQTCKDEKVPSPDKNTSRQREKASDTQEESGLNDGLLSQQSACEELKDLCTTPTTEVFQQPREMMAVTATLSPCSYYCLMFLMAWVCAFGNGIFPSIQSYSCLPYGNIAYHLSVTLSSMANPVACFLGFFLPYSSIRAISFLTAFSTVFAIYIGITAVMSPTPPLVGYPSGEFLVVTSWILFTGGISYIKMSIASLFRREEGRALVWCGAAQQMGSAVGSVVIFILVNYSDIFHSYSPC